MAISRDNSLQPRQLSVLIIENDPGAARLTKEAFREAGLIEMITSFPDGPEALAYLNREGRQASGNLPDLIFLDLHLPKMSGLEVLAELKSNAKFQSTPVVVVSGSANPVDVREAYELHASCYIRKPNDLHEFLRFIKICFEFWGSVATLPPKTDVDSEPVPV